MKRRRDEEKKRGKSVTGHVGCSIGEVYDAGGWNCGTHTHTTQHILHVRTVLINTNRMSVF